jgi:prefoldin subunit 5
MTDPAKIDAIAKRLQSLDESLAAVPRDIRAIKLAVAQIQTDVSLLRSVVTDHSYELKAYGERLRDLEQTY